MAELSGKFRFQTTLSSEYPAVGDFVLVNWNESGNSAIIESVLPRKSAFIRKAAGEPWQEQVVAANIDTVFLCMALNNDFNLRRLERYISIAWDSGATPVVVLTKSDLCDDLENRLSEVSSIAFGIDILVTTSTEENGYKELLPFISEEKTIAFIGSSGVGKSTLINRLLGKEHLKTNGLRNDDKGRHTTTRRELFLLPSGGMVIDTPGMREFGMWDNDTGIEKTFTDIEELAAQCKFRNCTHTNEPGCAIQKALTTGELQTERWQSYQKLKAGFADGVGAGGAGSDEVFRIYSSFNSAFFCGLLCGCDGKLNRAVCPEDFVDLQIFFRIKISDFCSKLGLKFFCVKMGDRPDAVFSGFQVLPGFCRIVSKRSDGADARYYDSFIFLHSCFSCAFFSYIAIPPSTRSTSPVT